MIEVFSWLTETVASVPPWLRNLIAGLAIMLETSIFAGLIIPGDTVVLVASTTVVDWGDFFWLLAAVLTGSLIGESIGFGVGHFFGPKIRKSRFGQRIGEKNWVRAERLVERRGGIAVFLSRFLPVLHSLVPAVAGAASMRYRTFITYTFFACLIWASAYVGVGFLARASYEQLSENLKVAAFVGIAIILVFMVLVSFAKKLLDKLTHHEDEEPKS